jgi:hypothetical protein
MEEMLKPPTIDTTVDAGSAVEKEEQYKNVLEELRGYQGGYDH